MPSHGDIEPNWKLKLPVYKTFLGKIVIEIIFGQRKREIGEATPPGGQH